MIIVSIFFMFVVTTFVGVYALLHNVGDSVLMTIALIFFFAACFLVVYALMRFAKQKPPEEKSKSLVIRVKQTLAIHKQFMKIEFVNKKANELWTAMGKPHYPLPEDIVVIKQLVAGFVLLMGLLIGLSVLSVFIAAGAFFIPDMYFKAQAQKRLRDIEKHFPSAIDLLTLCLEAGIDFMAALAKIVDNSDPNPLCDEFKEVIREMQLGANRRDAMLHFGKRCESIQEVASFVSLVVQAEALGTSLVDVLRSYAEEMRTRRWQAAEKRALEAPTKMLFPMLIFIFPGIFVLIFGPVVMQVMSMF